METEIVRVEHNMVFHECGDEIVRMVVSCLHPDHDWVPLISGSHLEVLRLQLVD